MSDQLLLTTPRAPYDRFTARRGDAAGGPAFAAPPMTHIEDGVTRDGAGAYANDVLIERDRMPVYMRDYIGSHEDTRTNWTSSGAIRPSLRMRQQSLRRQQGTDATRNFDPRPIQGYGSQDQGHGMHTNPAPWKRATDARYRATPQMQAAGVNRLTSARYWGQSYSQTTRVLGS